MSDEPEFAQQLNTVHRFAMGLVVDRPDTTPLTESVLYDTGRVDVPTSLPAPPEQTWHLLTIPNPLRALGDVMLTVRARGALVPYTYGVSVLLGPHVEGGLTFIDEFFDGDGMAFCAEQVAPFTIPAQAWVDAVEHSAEFTGSTDSLQAWLHVRFSATDPYEYCSTAFAQMTFEYQRRIFDPADVTRTWAVQPMSMHKTLVTGPGEESGVPRWKSGTLAINRRTRNLVMVTECYGVGSKQGTHQQTVSGGGVGPADAEGEQIPTRALPGTFESVTTGRLQGRVVRLTSDGTGPYE